MAGVATGWSRSRGRDCGWADEIHLALAHLQLPRCPCGEHANTQGTRCHGVSISAEGTTEHSSSCLRPAAQQRSRAPGRGALRGNMADSAHPPLPLPRVRDAALERSASRGHGAASSGVWRSHRTLGRRAAGPAERGLKRQPWPGRPACRGSWFLIMTCSTTGRIFTSRQFGTLEAGRGGRVEGRPLERGFSRPQQHGRQCFRVRDCLPRHRSCLVGCQSSGAMGSHGQRGAPNDTGQCGVAIDTSYTVVLLMISECE